MDSEEFYTKKELKSKGISTGVKCRISKKVRFYSSQITIGNRCRIDDDVVLKGKVVISNNVHLARGCTLSGGKLGIYLDDFAALSNFVQIYTVSDNYFSPSLPAATLTDKEKEQYSSIISRKIQIGKSVLIGTFSVILPGSKLEDFSSVAAYSVVYTKINKGIFYNPNDKNKNQVFKLRDIKKMEKKLKNFKK